MIGEEAAPVTDDFAIGLALSGGGMRAAVFHLGILQRVADARQLERVTFISTVSGGSLCVGLIYASNGNRWPTSERYLDYILPAARQMLIGRSIQRDAALRVLAAPHLLIQGRAKVIAASMQHIWGVSGLLKDVPTHPRWFINATAYESGKSWRFTPQRMGDYVLNYVRDPAIPLADAIAASAGFPVLIGPLVVDTGKYEWWRYPDASSRTMVRVEPKSSRIHLWDGGVYDNLGVEPLYKQNGRGLREEFNFLIVSDASADLAFTRPAWGLARLLRPTNIAMDQVRALRARSLIDHFTRNPGTGAYLRIGRTARHLLEQAGASPGQIEMLAPRCLDDAEVALAAGFATTLRRLTPVEFERLHRHGWEVADCVLTSWRPDKFPRIGL